MTPGKFIFKQYGEPEVLTWINQEFSAAGEGEVLVRHEAIGVDFIDVLMRSGKMRPALPSDLGFAAAGVVAALGSNVRGLNVGDRVAYMCLSPGSYATHRVVPAARVFRLPNQSMDARLAAGALFRGLTAWYLATRLRPINPEDVVLVHAAAGGVGQILLQWLQLLGARVVATVSTDEKAAVVRSLGCEDVVVFPRESFLDKVLQVSDGKGAHVVYESIGKATFSESMAAARRFGLIASYGWPSGDPDAVELSSLRGQSLFITRPTVTQYTAEPADFQEACTALFQRVDDGRLKISVGAEFPLARAAHAHEALEGGGTTGSVVLVL
ncbi:2-haloacrylate reductase [compost metagenome]